MSNDNFQSVEDDSKPTSSQLTLNNQIDKYNLDTKKKSLEDKIRDMPFSKIEKLYKMIEDYVSE